MGYTKAALKGVSWMSSFRFSTRILAFVKIAVLARVLNPTQFGVFAIATLVLSFLEILTETGINVILIQIKDDISEYVNTAWIVSILRGILISLIVLVSAPFIVSFFNTPEALNVLLLISIVPFIKGFINPAEVKFQKELNFSYEFWFRTILFFIDGVTAIVFALITKSVYSLVFGLIAGAVAEVIISFILIKPRPLLKFELMHFKYILNKGKWITGYSVFNYLGENLDNLIVGKLLGASPLGVYQMAYKISYLPISEIANVVNLVVFPLYSKIESDKNRLFNAFTKTTFAVSLAAVLIGLLIFAFPSLIISVLLGPGWESAVNVLRVLSLYGIIRAVVAPCGALFLSSGKQEYITVMSFVRLGALILTIYPFTLKFGIVGAGYSALFSAIIEIPVIIFLIYKIFSKK